MSHTTEHASEVLTRPVNPYARESLRKKLQQDRQTDRQTHRRIVQNQFPLRFEGCTYIPNLDLGLELDFCAMPTLSWDMEMKTL